MNKKLSTTLLSVSLFLTSATVFAAAEESAAPEAAPAASGTDMSTQMDEMFKKLDTNHDGMIDKKEAKADKALAKDFKKIAKKGKLDQENFNKWQESHKQMAD